MRRTIGFGLVLGLVAMASTAMASDWTESYVGNMYFQEGLSIDGGGVPRVNAETAHHAQLVRVQDPVAGTWSSDEYLSQSSCRNATAGMMPGGNVYTVCDDVGKGDHAWADTTVYLYDYVGGTGWEEGQPFNWLGFKMFEPATVASGNGLGDILIFGNYTHSTDSPNKQFSDDLKGSPALAWYDTEASAWTAEVVSGSTVDWTATDWEHTGYGHRLQFDGTGNPTALLYNATNQQLELHTRTAPGNWTAEGVAGTGGTANKDKAAFGYYNGVPYVAFVKYDDVDSESDRTGRLYLTHKDGASWSTPMLLDEDYLSPDAGNFNSTYGTYVDIDIVDDDESEFDGYMAINYSYNESIASTDGEARMLILDSMLQEVDRQSFFGDADGDGEPDSSVTPPRGDGFNQNLVEILPDGTVHGVFASFRDSGHRRDFYHVLGELDSPILLGDFDGNGAVNGLDIPGFKAALADPEQWAADNPDQPHPDLLGDFDGNGAFNGLDIPGFKTSLAGTAVPEPATLVLLGLGALGVIRRRRG